MTRSHKIILLGSLYLAQGLPYGFFTQALPVLLRDAGYSLKAISATSLLFLPWALKFLWAPFVDHRGTRKAWLLPLQCAGVAGALPLTRVDLGTGLVGLLVDRDYRLSLTLKNVGSFLDISGGASSGI